jgi:hypothetical protein
VSGYAFAPGVGFSKLAERVSADALIGEVLTEAEAAALMLGLCFSFDFLLVIRPSRPNPVPKVARENSSKD